MKLLRVGMICLVAAAFVCGLGSSALGQDSNGVPKSLLSKFTTGVNVTRWFCYLERPDDVRHFKSYLNDQDFAAFRSLGVHFVRLCISPEAIYRDGHADPTNLGYLDSAVARFHKAGIAVLWDLHDNGQLKLDAPGHDNSGFVSFWQDVARHYKGTAEAMTVFELLNEPQFNSNSNVWFALQEETVRAVRQIDPRRTIMVSSNQWSGIDALQQLAALPESNLIYTAHCYDPFFFTHQGASWVGDPPQGLKHVPFPSSPEAVQAILGDNSEKNQSGLKWYGEQRYDASFLLARLTKARDWAAQHHVPLVLGEFGAYPPVSPPDSRSRWFAAMKSAIDTLRLPAAVWGYDDALGLGRRMDGSSIWLDPVTLRSLYGKK